MRLRKFYSAGLALVLALTGLLTFAPPSAFAAGPYTCTWTGGGGDSKFSTATNWSGCNSSSPQPSDNDNLIFDNTSLGSSQTLNNDVSLLGVGDITFTGTGTFGYIITGNTITVNGNLTNSYSSNQLADIEAAINFTGSLNSGQVTDQAVGLGAIAFTGSPTLTFTNGSNSFSFPFSVNAISGSGSIVVASGASLELFSPSPSWTGPITVNSGGSLSFANTGTSTNMLGASSNTLTIDNGGTVDFSNITGTVPQNITVGGSGAILYNPTITKGNPTPQLTLTGTITLLSNTSIQVGQGATVVINGPLTGNFSLTLAGGSAGQLIIQSSNNQSATSNGTYGGTSGGTSQKAPGAPNTGLAALTVNPIATLAVTTVAALMIVIIARRLRPIKS